MEADTEWEIDELFFADVGGLTTEVKDNRKREVLLQVTVRNTVCAQVSEVIFYQ
jgi:hypothetical protein